MNTRRQTVWLVSMLGLMVVLSAYYLFTDEVDPVPANNEFALNEIDLEGTQLVDPTAADAGTVTVEGEDLVSGDAAADETAQAAEESEDTAGATEAAETTETADAAENTEATEPSDMAHETASTEEKLTDEEILRQMAAEKEGEEAIAAMQMERTEQLAQEIEQLTATITSSESNEEVKKATQRQNELIDLDARLIAFEEKLMANNYGDAVVTYDEAAKHYTVNVSAPSLEKSEAVSIIKMAIEDLKISMHQISVKLYR